MTFYTFPSMIRIRRGEKYAIHEKDSYILSKKDLVISEDAIRGDAINLLGKLEDLCEGLKVELEELDRSLTPYKKDGKIKNYRGKELLGRKLILHHTLSVLESYGVEVQYGKDHFDQSE